MVNKQISPWQATNLHMANKQTNKFMANIRSLSMVNWQTSLWHKQQIHGKHTNPWQANKCMASKQDYGATANKRVGVLQSTDA